MATSTYPTSWLRAYGQFLTSREESLALKVAPLVLLGILPAELMTNLLPVIGIADDIGYLGIGGFVVFKTLSRVRMYRHMPSH